MTEAEKILKMIEEVSPDDSAMLDEIDARVWCFINNYLFSDMAYLGRSLYFNMVAAARGEPIESVLDYTRSRDALKAIRPEGWWIDSKANVGCICVMYQPSMAHNAGYVHSSIGNNDEPLENGLPTEELAELHAIIQALQYTRQQK